jgi:hypothetical protein
VAALDAIWRGLSYAKSFVGIVHSAVLTFART